MRVHLGIHDIGTYDGAPFRSASSLRVKLCGKPWKPAKAATESPDGTFLVTPGNRNVSRLLSDKTWRAIPHTGVHLGHTRLGYRFERVN